MNTNNPQGDIVPCETPMTHFRCLYHQLGVRELTSALLIEGAQISPKP